MGRNFILSFINVYIQVLNNLNRKDAPELVLHVINTCLKFTGFHFSGCIHA